MTRHIITLPLPGDHDTVVNAETMRAIRRDGVPNFQERRATFYARWCAESKWKFPLWICYRGRPCCYCERINDD